MASLTWTCARCGHGSAELRDSAAHFDAHRRIDDMEDR